MAVENRNTKIITLERFIGIFYTIILLFFLQTPMKGLHIIGGDITYECFGNNEYSFKMKVYRDCFSPSGANLDPQAAITIFKFDGGSPSQYANFTTPLQSANFTPVESTNPCLEVPSDLCVEVGMYNFTITLPFHADGYLVAYQRCCRNNTISNIQTPDLVGATYTATLNELSQQTCNNSPTFNNFPPIAICAGEPIDFDHSANDVDGDSLVYSFCSPTIGASQNDPIPNSASFPYLAFPHYPTVSFIEPVYSVDFPIGGMPLITINPEDGFITGVPTNQGQFVVGVCVHEYKNGELVGIIRRDFQFNVTSCDPVIYADVREDFQLGPQEFVINSCGSTSVTFQNQSGQAQYIDGYLWEFEQGVGQPNYTTTAVNPTVQFPDVGTYEGTLIINPNSAECSDTALLFVNVYPEIQADFSFVNDSCIIGPVLYTDESFSGSGMITNWEWNFGDGNTSNVPSPAHQFADAGTYNVTLSIVDSNSCTDQISKSIAWYPESEILVELPEDEGCLPFSVSIINNSFPLNGYTTQWDLGDGTTTMEASPNHTYTQAGVYSLELTITSPIGCVSQQSFPNLVTVYDVPTADFSFSPEAPTNFAPEVSFTDLSSNASSWLWDFDTGDNSTQSNPTYVFADTGRHEVQLLVTHLSGCADSITKVVDVEPRFTYFLPNAFTPNFDDVNDGFRGNGIFYGIESFEMTIWNRWGEMVFHSKDPNVAWNGQKNNSGQMSKNGVYVYLVKIKGARDQMQEFRGYATLIR